MVRLFRMGLDQQHQKETEMGRRRWLRKRWRRTIPLMESWMM
jgi:hypothetical protein